MKDTRDRIDLSQALTELGNALLELAEVQVRAAQWVHDQLPTTGITGDQAIGLQASVDQMETIVRHERNRLQAVHSTSV